MIDKSATFKTVQLFLLYCSKTVNNFVQPIISVNSYSDGSVQIYTVNISHRQAWTESSMILKQELRMGVVTDNKIFKSIYKVQIYSTLST